VNSFQDLPSESEIFDFDIKYLMSSEKLIESQKNDKKGENIYEFKLGKTKLLFTTRCNRGIDFPFQTCNSVVITKFPYPNTQSLFWKILKQDKPLIFWEFYNDKARRELLQRIYRSVRAKDDHIFLLSPDVRVLRSTIGGKSNI
jgi:Rad3-related DNA helicase